jgi:hypothetical protein
MFHQWKHRMSEQLIVLLAGSLLTYKPCNHPASEDMTYQEISRIASRRSVSPVSVGTVNHVPVGMRS